MIMVSLLPALLWAEELFEMEEVMVTGSQGRYADPDDLPVPVQIIDRQQIDDIGAVTLDQVLEVTVGVEVVNSPDQNTSPGFQTLRMQGMDSDYVLILVDGKRLPGSRPTQNGQSFTDISTINVDMIERIEVLRDGASAQYGSDAVAGVINIITKQYVSESSASFQYGANTEGDGQEGALSVTGGAPLGDLFYLSLNASGKQRDHYDRTEDDRWDSADFTQGAFSGSLAFDPADNHNITLDWRYSDSDSVYLMDRTNRNETEKVEKHGGLSYHGSYENVEFEFASSITGQDILKEKTFDNSYRGDLDWRLDEYYGNLRWQALDWLYIFSGVTSLSESIDSHQRNIDKTRRVGALFSEVGISPIDRIDIQLSARWEDYSDFGGNFAPKLAARWEIIDGLSVRGSVSDTFKVPSLFQLYDDTEVMDWLELAGNPNLKPSEGRSSSVGIVWQARFRTRISLDIFHNSLDNLIDTELKPKNDGSGKSEGSYVNLRGESIFKGANLSFTTDLPYGFNIDSGASYLMARDPQDHDLTGRPRSTAHISLGYRYEGFWGNIRYNYRGQYLDHNRKRISDYDYFSLQLNYAVNDGFTLYMGGRNIFDEEPPLNPADYASGHIEGMVDSNEGSRYYAGLRLKF